MIDVIAAIVIAVFVVVRWPELLFVLFLNAGVFKGSPQMVQIQQALGIDATVALEVLTTLGIAVGFVGGRLKPSLPRRDSVVPFACFIVLAAASLLYTSGPLYGREKLARLCLITAYAFWAPAVAFGTERSINRLLTAWAAFSVFVVVMSMSGSWGSPVLFRQAFGNTSGYLMISYCSAQTALFCVILAGDGSIKWIKRTVLIVVAIACAAGALLSGSRAGPVALLLTLIILLLTVIWRGLTRAGNTKRRYGHFVVLLLLFVSLVGLVVAQGDLFSGFLSRSDVLYSRSQEYEGQRLEMAALAVQLTLSHPLGVGLGGFTDHYLGWDDIRGAFAHNIFLEIGSELGLVGLAIFLKLCWNALRPYFGVLQGKDHHIPITGLALALLFVYMVVVYQFHGDMNDARVMWAWAGALFSFRRHLRPAAANRPSTAVGRLLLRTPVPCGATSR